MSKIVRFTAARLPSGKVGKLVPDADGYYTLVIGGLNVFNSKGEYYSLDGAKTLFEASSSLMRQIKRGALRGEVDHPEFERGMTENDYLYRLYKIDPKNTCAHFKEIWLDPEVGRKLSGGDAVAIMAKVAPTGVHGQMLKEQLERGGENVCFSIRGFTDDMYINGRYTRVLKQIITFDYVNEPGIPIAEKFKSPAIESFAGDLIIGESMAFDIANRPSSRSIACEEAVVGINDLINEMGWKMSKQNKPGFSVW